MLKVQLAFQGGGAKIVALLAAAEAVQELEKKSEVKVTRLAGTSAGAIVAALLAAEVSIPAVRDRLRSQYGQNLIAKFPKKSSLTAVIQALQGKRFWNDAPLAEWLETELGAVRQFSDLKRKLFVYSANLEAGGAEVQISSDLVTALLESAGLPFCFRTWRSGGQTINVDGGLCQNLPVDDLLADTSHGRVLGFTFPSARPGRPKNVLSFSMSLLDVAMGHSVQSARSRLGSRSVCTLQIPPNLTTFNFDQALKYLASHHYSDTKGAVLNWFQQLIDSTASQARANFDHDIWREPVKDDVHSEMRKVGRIYKQLSAHQQLRYHAIKLQVVGNCLLSVNDKNRKSDEVLYVLEFEPRGDPLIAHHLTFSNSQEGKFFGQYSLELASSTQAEMPCEVLASISPESETAREVVVFFSPPLKSGTGEYSLSLQDEGVDLLNGLIDPEARSDYLEIDPKYKHEPIGLIQFAVQVPKILGEVSVRVADDIGGAEMSERELHAAFGKPRLGFRSFGWQATNIPAKQVRVTFSV